MGTCPQDTDRVGGLEGGSAHLDQVQAGEEIPRDDAPHLPASQSQMHHLQGCIVLLAPGPCSACHTHNLPALRAIHPIQDGAALPGRVRLWLHCVCSAM